MINPHLFVQINNHDVPSAAGKSSGVATTKPKVGLDDLGPTDDASPPVAGNGEV